MGRKLPGPGEALFTEDDTAAAIALAEEERDTCPSCGLPKVWCRDPAQQFSFEVREEQCWSTYAVASRREKRQREAKTHGPTRDSMQFMPRFREGKTPRFDAGLDLD